MSGKKKKRKEENKKKKKIFSFYVWFTYRLPHLITSMILLPDFHADVSSTPLYVVRENFTNPVNISVTLR